MKLRKKSTNKKLYIYVFLLLFVGVGSVLAITQAASKPGYDRFKNNAVLRISYYNEKPTTISKTAGQTNYISRARTIDVTADNILFCTPEDNGVITSRQLSNLEQQQISNTIAEARSLPLEENVDQASDAELAQVNDYRGLYIRDGAATKSTNIYTPELESDYFIKTVQLLESFCVVPSNPIPDTEQPKWISGSQVVSQNTKKNKNPVKEAFLPTAEAGGTPVSFGLDTIAENQQHLMLAQARKGARLPATTRTDCLDQAARKWAERMAADKWMRHSKPIAALPEKYCGKDWAKLGENVGLVGVVTNIPNSSASINASTAIFNAFMKSPGHKANILDPAFTEHGVGAYKTADGKLLFIAQTFKRPAAIK